MCARSASGAAQAVWRLPAAGFGVNPDQIAHSSAKEELGYSKASMKKIRMAVEYLEPDLRVAQFRVRLRDNFIDEPLTLRKSRGIRRVIPCLLGKSRPRCQNNEDAYVRDAVDYPTDTDIIADRSHRHAIVYNHTQGVPLIFCSFRHCRLRGEAARRRKAMVRHNATLRPDQLQ